jgi:hypothetical protein
MGRDEIPRLGMYSPAFFELRDDQGRTGQKEARPA